MMVPITKFFIRKSLLALHKSRDLYRNMSHGNMSFNFIPFCFNIFFSYFSILFYHSTYKMPLDQNAIRSMLSNRPFTARFGANVTGLDELQNTNLGLNHFSKS